MNNHSRIFAAWRNSKCFLNARFAARTFRNYLEMAVPLLHFYFLSRAIQFRFISAISVKWNVPLWRTIKMTQASPFLFLHHCVGAPENVCVCVCVSVCVFGCGKNNCITPGASALWSRVDWPAIHTILFGMPNLIYFPAPFLIV